MATWYNGEGREKREKAYSYYLFYMLCLICFREKTHIGYIKIFSTFHFNTFCKTYIYEYTTFLKEMYWFHHRPPFFAGSKLLWKCTIQKIVLKKLMHAITIWRSYFEFFLKGIWITLARATGPMGIPSRLRSSSRYIFLWTYTQDVTSESFVKRTHQLVRCQFTQYFIFYIKAITSTTYILYVRS